MFAGKQAQRNAERQGRVHIGKLYIAQIHASIGKASFEDAMLKDNARELIQTIIKLKPSSAKGTYVKSLTVSTTMGPGVKIDTNDASAASI